MFQHLRQYLVRVALACCAFVWLVAVADASEIESFDVIRMNTGPAAAGGEALHEPFFGASKVAARAGDRLFSTTLMVDSLMWSCVAPSSLDWKYNLSWGDERGRAFFIGD